MNMPITRLLHTCRRTLAPALLLSLAATAVHAQDAAGICRVTDAIGNTGDGRSWATPMTLDSALAASACTAIWAKHGTYKPTVMMEPNPTDTSIVAERTKAFDISRPLKLYGGFAGTEATLAERVLSSSQPTILSGDLAGNDAANLQGDDLRDHATRADNSYHVVVIGGLNQGNNTVAYTTENTVLDGLTITAGNANGASGSYTEAGGLLCGVHCSPTISNSTFSGNSASYGGAIYLGSGNPTISNSTFSDNFAYLYGGAFYSQTSNRPTISNSTFSGNSAGDLGGAIYNRFFSRTTISNSTFSGNSAGNKGGAIYNNIAIPPISNSTFSGNYASYGGAIYNYNSDITISNSTFSGNSASQEGGAIYNDGSTPQITASILWGNMAPSKPQITLQGLPIVKYSIVQGGWTFSGTGNSDQDPNLSALADHGGPTRTMLPAADGPAVTPGYLCTAVTSPPNTDQRGVARPTSGSGCHIGAAQRVLTPSLLTVTTSGTGTGTVSSAPAGITVCATHPNASGGCTASFGDAANPSTSTSIALTATASAGSSLTGWSGSGASACSSASSTCTVVMDADKSVEAQFGLVASDAQTPSGPVTVALSGAQCTFTSGPTYAAAPTSGVPTGYTALPYGQIGFGATGCSPGGTLTITLTLPTPPAANAKLLKWDGSAWQPWAATLSGNTVTYNVTDNIGAGGAFTGDTNAAPGLIDDPVMLALFTAGSTVAIPTLSEWGLLITSLLLAALAVAHHLRRQRRSTR